ncbi:MAG TPA: FtsX-like permease family protein [Tepidisphaeraceae bacterium]|nr:FtsX-like permease family protein [Tepidisphaeraceae bacterium]
MYKLHLILKYLRKRRIAWVSLAAVCLCTTMVLVVFSVMGGWLRMFRTSFHGLSGDVVIAANTLQGFAHYEEIIARVEKLPEVEAAVPVLQTYGLINVDNQQTSGVQVRGIPIERIGRVNQFPTSLSRQYTQWAEWADGAPIPVEARLRVREFEDAAAGIREPLELLKFTQKELAALAKAAPNAPAKAEAVLADLRDQAARATTQAEQRRLGTEMSDVRFAAEMIAKPDELTRLSARGNAYFRAAVDRMFDGIIDSPDERLAPSADERKFAAARRDHNLANPSFKPFLPPDQYKQAFADRFPRAKKGLADEAVHWPGIVTGTGVVGLRKDATGKMGPTPEFYYTLPVTLTVMGMSDAGKIDLSGGGKAERNFWITDTSRTKVWQYDSNTVYVPFEILQADLGMNAQQAERDGKPVTIPARTSEVHVRAKPGMSDDSAALLALRQKVQQIVDAVVTERGGHQPAVKTWEQSQAVWLSAIEKELVLVTGLFSVISVVAVFLIFCIFYMIVVEKTRDIGIIKSVGATSTGVAGIFLGYGAAIGVVGAGLGLGLAYVIVTNINELHGWLGTAMGVQIWDPQVYAFETIPNTMDWPKVVWIVGIAVGASIVGALIPAYRAARLNPVEALRWE